jgi:hypothetical protein
MEGVVGGFPGNTPGQQFGDAVQRVYWCIELLTYKVCTEVKR